MPHGLYRRKGSKTWYCLIYHEGKRVRESTGTADRKEAEKYYDDLRQRLREQAAKPSISWKDACIRWLKAGDRSSTDRYNLRALDYEDRPLVDCTAESFEKALEHLTPATFNRYRSIIAAVCNLSGHKLKLTEKKVKTGRLRFLTREEWQKLYLALPTHLKPIASFALATGLRQHNVTHLRWDQIDMQRATMWVHADMAKANRAIGIPLSEEAMDVLTSQSGKSEEWVFPYKGRGKKAGKPITKVKTAWHSALERSGFAKGEFTFHGLRHTWASWHIMAGTPIEVLAKLGGWNDLRMVQRYAHLAPEHLASFAGNARPWSRTATKTATAA